MFQFQCPGCDHAINYTSVKAGLSGVCPACNVNFRFPSSAEGLKESPRNSGLGDTLSKATSYHDKEHEQSSFNSGSRSSSFAKKLFIFGWIVFVLLALGVAGVAVFVGNIFESNSTKAERVYQKSIATLDEMAEILETVKDRNTAKAAAPRLKTLSAELNKIVKESRNIVISGTEKSRVEAKYSVAHKASVAKVVKQFDRLLLLPDAAEEVRNAMAELAGYLESK